MRLADLLRGIVNLILGVVLFFLGMRFILRLFGANRANGFVDWIYETSADILAPFRNIFPTTTTDGYVFEFSTLFAMLVYGLLGMFVLYLINLLSVTVDDHEEGEQNKKSRKK